MSGHPADSGPSASSNAANPAGTGFSEATASFIAANGSPFISPMDMIPSGVKVPDPRVTDRTCSATITARFSCPVVADGVNGKLMVAVNADPMSQLPIWVSRTLNEQHPGKKTNVGAGSGVTADAFYYNEPTISTGSAGSDRCDPRSWGQTYDVLNIADIFAQTKHLGELSQRHRVVGCGLRANIGVDTAIARGTIEGGQFTWVDTRDTTTSSVEWDTALQTNRLGYWSPDVEGGLASWTNACRTSDKSQKGMRALIHSNAYNVAKTAIRSARSQNIGVLDGDQGCSVRWTDTNNFKFQRTINRNLLLPNKDFYANGFDVSQINAFEHEDTYKTYILDCNTTRAVQAGTGTYPGKIVATLPFSPLCVATRPHINYDATKWSTATSTYLYFAADSDMLLENTSGTVLEQLTAAGATNNVGDGTFADLGVTTFEEQFDKGLYIDITGVNTGQWVNVDVVWHIEYVPRSYALTTGLQSPVDLNFDMVAAMLTDAAKFPIVVKGHSFFSSLWAGVKRAFGKGREIIGAAGPMLSMLPSPHARAAGMAMSAASGMIDTAEQTYKRIRYA